MNPPRALRESQAIIEKVEKLMEVLEEQQQNQ